MTRPRVYRFCRWHCHLCHVAGQARDPVREIRLHLLHAHSSVTTTRLSLMGTGR